MSDIKIGKVEGGGNAIGDNNTVNNTDSSTSYNITGNVGSIGNQGTIGNSAGEVKGDMVYNAADAQADADTLKEIQDLIANLSQSQPTDSTVGQMTVATAVIGQIEGNPTWKQRAISAAKSAGLAALKSNPIGKIVASAIEGWTNA